MDKFNRSFLIRIQSRLDLNDPTAQTGYIQVGNPFTIEFAIQRDTFHGLNNAKFRIFNLHKDTRSQIRKDQFDIGEYRSLEFFAGYGKNMPLAFKGNITLAWSARENNNFITEIDCFDGGIAMTNGVTDLTVPRDTTQQAIVDSMVDSLSAFGVTRGAVTEYPGTNQRANAYSGPTTEILSEITGGGFFIDNGKANCLNDNEAIRTVIPVINSQSGLLGTPLREGVFTNIDTLFSPELMIGQVIELQSETDETFNGRYKIISLSHKGVISDAIAGSATSHVGLLPGEFTFVGDGSTNG